MSHYLAAWEASFEVETAHRPLEGKMSHNFQANFVAEIFVRKRQSQFQHFPAQRKRKQQEIKCLQVGKTVLGLYIIVLNKQTTTMMNNDGTHPSTPASRSSNKRRSANRNSTPRNDAMVPYYRTTDSTTSTPRAMNTMYGTSEKPIWVGDVDVEDDLTEESNVAIRGVRRNEDPKRVPPAEAFSTGKKASTSSAGKRKQSKRNKSKSASQPGSPKSQVSSSSTGSEKRSTKSKSSNPFDDNFSTTNSKSKIASNTRGGLHIDVTALDDDDVDPELEKELEEIALTGRGGLISGTPSAHDLEKGKKQKPAPIPVPMKKITPSYDEEEDEADRSWHGYKPGDDEEKRKTHRKRIIYGVVLLGLLCGIAVVLIKFVIKGGSDDEQLPPLDESTLTASQQTMHDIILGITPPNILEDPASPQYEARRWLLFRDSENTGLHPSRVLQRYALATFFFATGGVDSWAENAWLKGHECASSPWQGLNCDSQQEVRTLMLGTFIPICPPWA